MLYIIGLGLNTEGITLEGLEAVKNSSKIYLEGYTVDFPYSVAELEKSLSLKDKKIELLNRAKVESDFLIKEAKNNDISLLVYGCPLFATTHETLILDAKKAKVSVKIIYSASVFDAISSCGLQLYKFGKITSMPKWIESKFEPDSFLDIVKENNSIKAHSIILTDIGLELKPALEQLQEASKRKNLKLDKIIVCSRLGTKYSKIYYDTIENLKKNKIPLLFCIIIPSEMHFMEKEALENVSE